MYKFGFLLLIFLLNGIMSSMAQSEKKHVVLPQELMDIMQNDSSGKLYIFSVLIEGNRRTKERIILREMAYKQGDSIPVSHLYEILEEARSLIYNTNLFSLVEVRVEMNSAFAINIHIKLIERIYLVPSPEFTLSDRNFNEWWKTYNADLDRITYGVKIRHSNLTGNADRISLFAMNGFSRLLSLQYTTPYVNKEMTKGISAGITYTRQRELIYKTTFENKLLTYRKENYINENFFIQMSYLIRKGFYTKQNLQFNLTIFQVDDSILDARYNPDYFLTGTTNFIMPEISYTHQYIKTDNVNYPRAGRLLNLRLAKRGIGWSGDMNALMLDASYKWYRPINKHWFYSWQMATKIRMPFKQPYLNRLAFGYADYYLRGLEFRVIDAVASGIQKFTLTRGIMDRRIKIPLRNRYIPFLPVKLYLKSYADVGYAYDRPENRTRLSNKLLYTGGVGLDVLTLYDIQASFEYSLNQLNEKGLFLRVRGFL